MPAGSISRQIRSWGSPFRAFFLPRSRTQSPAPVPSWRWVTTDLVDVKSEHPRRTKARTHLETTTEAGVLPHPQTRRRASTPKRQPRTPSLGGRNADRRAHTSKRRPWAPTRDETATRRQPRKAGHRQHDTRRRAQTTNRRPGADEPQRPRGPKTTQTPRNGDHRRRNVTEAEATDQRTSRDNEPRRQTTRSAIPEGTRSKRANNPRPPSRDEREARRPRKRLETTTKPTILDDHEPQSLQTPRDNNPRPATRSAHSARKRWNTSNHRPKAGDSWRPWNPKARFALNRRPQPTNRSGHSTRRHVAALKRRLTRRIAAVALPEGRRPRRSTGRTDESPRTQTRRPVVTSKRRLVRPAEHPDFRVLLHVRVHHPEQRFRLKPGV
jgi:hypothetical protein